MRIFAGNSDSPFFLGVLPLLTLEIWRKLNLFLKQFVSATPLNPLNWISWKFVVIQNILCTCAYMYSPKFLIQYFFLGVTPLKWWANVMPVQYLAMVLTTRILQVFSIVPNIDQKFEHLKHFVWIDDNVLAYKRKIGSWAHFLQWQW